MALTLARKGDAATQASPEVRDRLSAAYEQDTAQLIHASHLVAVQFQTIGAANGCGCPQALDPSFSGTAF